MKKNVRNKIAVVATALVSIFSGKGKSSAVQLDNTSQSFMAVGGGGR